MYKKLSYDEWDRFMRTFIICGAGFGGMLLDICKLLHYQADPLVAITGTFMIGIGMGGWVVDDNRKRDE